MGQGFGDRLLNEVKKVAVKDVKLKIYAPPERKYSTWIGGSILAGLNTFKKASSFIDVGQHALTAFTRCGCPQKSTRKIRTSFTRSLDSDRILSFPLVLLAIPSLSYAFPGDNCQPARIDCDIFVCICMRRASMDEGICK